MMWNVGDCQAIPGGLEVFRRPGKFPGMRGRHHLDGLSAEYTRLDRKHTNGCLKLDRDNNDLAQEEVQSSTKKPKPQVT